jgi:hypothetical protein
MRKILFLLIIITASCTADKKKDLFYLLTNNDCKYWDMVYNPRFYDKTKSITFPYYCYCFDKNNNYNFFCYNNGIRQPYRQNDIIIPKSWSLISDSSIFLGNKVFKIEKLTKDTLIFSSGKNDSTVLVQSLKK